MQVWVGPLLVADDVRASLVAVLSPEERARTARYRSAADARRYSVGRGWLRHVVAAASTVPPAEVRLSPGPGKPRVAEGTGPCFNLARAGELVVVALSGCEVGVDVEPWERGAAALDAVAVACTADERDALSRVSPAWRAEAFLALWTAKEAYLKATGSGLAVAPDRVAVGVGAGREAVEVRVVDDDGAARRSGWWARPLPPVPGYVGAVAAEGAGWVVELRSTSELPVVARSPAARP